MRGRVRFLLVAGWAFCWAAPAAAADLDLDRVARLLRNPTLTTSNPILIQNVTLEIGPARIHLEKGRLFPAAPVGRKSMEMVFLGTGRVTVDPGNDIESDQLELFTEQRVIDNAFEDAVFVLTGETERQLLMGSPRRIGANAAEVTRARELFDRWKNGPERSGTGIVEAQFRSSVDHPGSDRFFAAWFQDTDEGEILFLYDPFDSDGEPVKIGQTMYRELSERERRKLERVSRASRRRSQRILAGLGQLTAFNLWASFSDPEETESTRSILGPFEPKKYTLDLTIEAGGRGMNGRASLRLITNQPGQTILSLFMNPGLKVQEIKDGSGSPRSFFQADSGWILVHMPEPPAVDEVVTLEIAYTGNLLKESDFGSLYLSDTVWWHPHAGWVDRAEYDVTFHWPKGKSLLSAGRLVEEGVEPGGMKKERRVFDKPVMFFTFEFGDFNVREEMAGEVKVRIAFDRLAKYLNPKSRDEIVETVVESLMYFEEVFGPYPLDEILVVTAPRYFSQGSLGFLTLSVYAMQNWGAWSWLYGIEDRRTVIAHEMAHQWWGNLIGFQTYHDQWISEAMATYASLKFKRDRLEGGKARPGPITGWQRQLGRGIGEGRTVESIGPLVMGPRLSSTLDFDAYQTIVYTKGAIVMDMFSRIFPKGEFEKVLKQLVQYAAYREVSTETFLASLEKMTGVDLDWFARQYIYGTGIPEVYYRFEFIEGEDGSWRLSGEAEQQSDYGFEYRLVEQPEGGIDVVRAYKVEMEVGDSNLVVPFRVGVFAAEMEAEGKKKKKKNAPPEINAALNGRIILRGKTTPFTMKMTQYPLDFWLDRDKSVLATFFCESREPRRMMYHKGLNAAAEGRQEDAERLLIDAVKADVFVSTNPNVEIDREAMAHTGNSLNRLIYLRLAQLYLDQGDNEKAQKVIDGLQKFIDKNTLRWLRARLLLLQARLDLQMGEFQSAFQRLRKEVGKKGLTRSTEGYLLLAIAARETGNEADWKRAVEVAEGRGIDVALIDPDPDSDG